MRVVSVLFDYFPALASRVPWSLLAELPTPVHDGSAIARAAGSSTELWLKRDDCSSPIYGGNKVRLLEFLLAEAKAAGATEVYATGALGSNFALACALHAPRLGLGAGAICFSQPVTADGERNQRALAVGAHVVTIPHWSLLPLAVERLKRRAEREGRQIAVLSQVRFSAEGLFGYLAAGLELARQVELGACPAPARIVLPIGSAATSAGIVAGLSLARKLGRWRAPLPHVEAVRIAAWPLSRRARVLALAHKVLGAVARLGSDSELELSARELTAVSVVTEQLGAGYPLPTRAGTAARELFARAGYPILDDTYSAKAAAHALERLRASAAGPVLFWCTKSSAPLPRS